MKSIFKKLTSGILSTVLAAGMFLGMSTSAYADGQVLVDVNFDDGSVGDFMSYTNGGQYDLENADKMLSCHIVKTGTLDYANQAYLDGFSLTEGAVYKISFDAQCDIDRKIEYRIQINGGDYHAYVTDYAVLSKDMAHYEKEFTMEEASDPAPRFAFNMGLEDDMDSDPGEHTIKIDNLKIELTDATNAKFDDAAENGAIISMNHIGYRPEDQKIVVADGSLAGTEFSITNTKTGKAAFTGKFGKAFDDAATEKSVCQGDFSELKDPGAYFIYYEYEGEKDHTASFIINENVYRDISKAAFKMLTLQRCGTELNKKMAGIYAHPKCHMSEATIYGTKDKKDVSGGWHDAGDYGRYVVSGAQTVEDLFLMYENDSEFGQADNLGIMESKNDVPDVLDEARYELEWMLKMQDEKSGGVYHKVTCANFPGTVMPEEETEELILSPISQTATGDLAAVMAKASEIYKDYDEAFAEMCQKAAISAWAYLMEQKKPEGFKNPSDISTGEYPDEIVDDEIFWAAVELESQIQKGNIKDDALAKQTMGVISDKMKSGINFGLGWADMGGFGLYDLANMDCKDKDIEKLSEEAEKKIIEQADQLYRLMEKDGYFCTMGTNYYWGSNMGVANNGVTFLMAKYLTEDDKYQEAAKKQLDYLLGVNGRDFCYVSGFGEASLKNPHHRPSQNKGKAMAGMLAGGPNANLEDPYAQQVLKDKAPGLCYADNDQSYSTNEVAIYWNSPLSVLLSSLD